MHKNDHVVSKEIHGKVSDKLYKWYEQEAKKRNKSISEFLEEIPYIIEELEEELSSVESEVRDLTGMGHSY